MELESKLDRDVRREIQGYGPRRSAAVVFFVDPGGDLLSRQATMLP